MRDLFDDGFDDPFYDAFDFDGNGYPTRQFELDGQMVTVHYADIPEKDITTIQGLRVTTPLRTLIDLAPEIDREQLDVALRDCLRRRLFTIEEARARLAEPDVRRLPGARILGAALPR